MAVNLKRLVYFDSFMDPIANAIIGRRDDIDLVRLDYATPEADNWSEISRAHGYQVQPRGELREPWFGDAALLARCPNMLALSSTGAGYDMIDVDACTAAGVIVVNQSGTNWEPVAEHALGMMLSLTKKIALSERAMKRTPDLDRRPYAGNNLRNKTVGIVGIGHIGRRVAELCGVLFNMTVLAYDPYLTDGADRRARRHQGGAGRTAAPVGLRHGALPAQRRDVRHVRRRAVRGDEAVGVFHQHRPRRHPRRGGAGRGAARGPDRRRGPRCVPEGAARSRRIRCCTWTTSSPARTSPA